jgi:SAM-dependent methyltransferase
MGNEFRGIAAHSAENFGDTRDHWWNLDFLRLMARRWRLDEARDVLDVGCGVGHWGMLLAAVMRNDVRVTGIDREQRWVDEATARARARGLDARFTYRQGEAQRLPFSDASFDLVTCQTVLIHMPDPAAVVREMMRVAKPGGLLFVAEPNNMTESLLLDSITNKASIDDVIDLVRFQLTCERGKVALGEGDNSLGDRVPGLFAAQGLERVETYLNDKATAIVPPYASDAERAMIEDARDRIARRFWNWSEDETRRFFLAGGGAERDFSGYFERGLAAREKIVRGFDDSTYYGVAGGTFYLIAGRKPAGAKA